MSRHFTFDNYGAFPILEQNEGNCWSQEETLRAVHADSFVNFCDTSVESS